jgi:hypothetical protein
MVKLHQLDLTTFAKCCIHEQPPTATYNTQVREKGDRLCHPRANPANFPHHSTNDGPTTRLV